MESTLGQLFVLNIVLVFTAVVLTGMLSREDRLWNAWVVGTFSATISFWAWVIYVIVHFLAKYW